MEQLGELCRHADEQAVEQAASVQLLTCACSVAQEVSLWLHRLPSVPSVYKAALKASGAAVQQWTDQVSSQRSSSSKRLSNQCPIVWNHCPIVWDSSWACLPAGPTRLWIQQSIPQEAHTDRPFS